MRKKEKLKVRKMKLNKKLFLTVLILFIGIGLAAISTQLGIYGDATLKGSPWNIYFDNVVVSEGSVSATLPTISNDKTNVNFEINLERPGEYYEFTVDVVNDGKYDALITSVNLIGVPSNLENIIIYEVSYADGGIIYGHDLLRGKQKNTYKVFVKYSDTIQYNELVATDTTLNLSLSVTYEQANVFPNEELTSFTQKVRNASKNDRSLNFAKSSSNSNGKGLYVLHSTEEDTHPIYYYRGAVDNNNFLFAGFCWKGVRTTDTGGTKLIYNGNPKNIYSNPTKIERSSYLNVNNDASYAFTYDSTTNEWTSTNHNHSTTSTITFTLPEAGTYYINYKVSSESCCDYVRFYTDDTLLGSYGGSLDDLLEITVTASTVIKVTYRKDGSVSTGTDNVVFSVISDLGEHTEGCKNTAAASTRIGSSYYNSSGNSLASGGYMYGTSYNVQSTTINNTYLYGTSFSYSEGTYTLANTSNTADNSHHYTCLNAEGTCTNIYYISYLSGTTAYYITLSGGKSVQNAIDEMNVNTNDSTVKATIDTWFSSNISDYFTNLGKDYNDYLEDTIFCNDRSTISEGNYAFSNSGWNSSNGSLNNPLYFSAYERFKNGTPTLACSNKNDAFTVTETETGNGALTYPVGLLTSDELNLAGASTTGSENNYLYSSQIWWTMTPYRFYSSYEDVFYGSTLGYTNYNNSCGIRPVISLAPTVRFTEDGDGTGNNPYKIVIE